MTMQELSEQRREHWGLLDILWRKGMSTREIAAAAGYKDRKTFAIKLVSLRRRYPDLFAARPKGFETLESRVRKLAGLLRQCANELDSIFTIAWSQGSPRLQPWGELRPPKNPLTKKEW